ncbi:MAG: Ykof family thiamine-binding protein [Spirochaetes bacterium]|nr:Ykof family thiamine-binding protein [Spirochaetota bacterium]
MHTTPNNSTSVFGCRMSIYPICNNYSKIILGCLDKVDRSKVWSATEMLSTVYRGKQSHVLDCARAVFLYTCKECNPTVGRFAFTKEYIDANSANDCFLNADDNLCNAAPVAANAARGDLNVMTQFSFYALGTADYTEHSNFIISIAEKRGLKPEQFYYTTTLDGNADEIFAFLDEALTYAQKNLPSFVLEAAIAFKDNKRRK